MKDFFKTLFASILGVIIGASILGFLSFLVFIGIAMSGSSGYHLEDKTILVLDLNGVINERENSSPFAALLGESESTGLDDMTDAIKKAKENDEIKGIYIKAGSLNCGIADMEPVRNALIDFKESGKFVVAYGDSYSQGAYYIASTADKVIMNPSGTFDFHGVSAGIMFVRGMYEKLGIKMQVFKVGTFKSAVEPYIQDQMSDANRLQTSSYINDVWTHILNGISGCRNIPVAQLNQYADQCLTFEKVDSIVKYGMIDTLMYANNLEAYLKSLTGTDEKDDLNLASVKDLTSIAFKKKESGKDKIAVLYAEGEIVDAESGSSIFSSDPVITAKEYVKELKKLKEDEDVKAVVFRVNSPGGSAFASEQIWNALTELKAVKPVVVSMGTYAASGGYYISCAANTIVAEPTTLTGSIGIFGLIPDGSELARKMGVTFDEVNTNAHGGYGGMRFGIPFLISAQSRGFTDEESRMLQKYVENGYDLFLTRCADGRSKTKAEIDSIGQGRVWTGKQALEIGLVDKLGNIEDALKIAAEAAKIDAYILAKYPAKKDFFSQLLEESLGSTKVKALRFFMGEEEYSQKLLLKSLQKMDVKMAVMPDRIRY
ncbi:signal peptide peptidase SppA [Viscerimonas tarda]